MFSDLKTELEGVEGKLRTTFADVEAKLTELEAQIATIDAPLLGAFDKASALAQKTQGLVTARLGQVRATIQRLVT